jgi:hypothetical protein
MLQAPYQTEDRCIVDVVTNWTETFTERVLSWFVWVSMERRSDAERRRRCESTYIFVQIWDRLNPIDRAGDYPQ